MKKLMVVIGLLLMVGPAIANPLQKEHFDERMDQLQENISDIKGDTTQIVSILGDVFEGTVPEGGTITSLINQNGWNIVVLMGHNNISNPDVVAGGQKFTYPATKDEFDTALAKGRTLYKAWLATKKKTFRVDRIAVDTVDIDKLNVRVAHFSEQLKIKNMDIDHLRIRLAEITEQLNIKQANIDELNVKQANIEQLHIKQLEIDNLKDLFDKACSRIATLEARPAKVVVQYRDVPADIGAVTCKDNPWDAVGIWETFPDGAIGTESQSRQNDTADFKYKLVTRKGNKIIAIKCFKSNDRLALADLASKWSKPTLGMFEDFETGDGGKHNTLQIGILKN